MKTIHTLIAGLLVVAFLLAATTFAADRPDATAKTPTLDTIKKLAGEWVALDGDGNPTDRVVSRIRVTAGGSAVLEELFPGTDHEMITLYHQDGDDLVLTHYCVMGNQPRMKAARGTGLDRIVFECTGAGTNMAETDRHMHTGVIEILGEHRLRTTWNAVENGEDVHEAKFDLKRRTPAPASGSAR